MPAYRFGFVFDYELGHITHQKNLERHLADELEIHPEWLLFKPEMRDAWDRTPLIKHHLPLRQSLRARRAVRARHQASPMDLVYCHTQVMAMLGKSLPRSVPLVISLDATPRDFARLGAYHAGGAPRIPKAGLKFKWARWAFCQADALVTFSAWAKRSLAKDYGIEQKRVAVIPPGVDLDQWHPSTKAPIEGRRARLLFVGGGFRRKGGPTLIEAFTGQLAGACELDIVSNDAPQGADHVRVHRGLSPNTPELRALYNQADLFLFPSRGDCTPIATIEAMASGLPIIATDVGGLPEQVSDGVNGLIVPPDSAGALGQAARSLIGDSPRRLAMGAAGRKRAEQWFDARRNYRSLIALLKSCADAGRRKVASPDAAGFGLPIPMPQ